MKTKILLALLDTLKINYKIEVNKIDDNYITVEFNIHNTFIKIEPLLNNDNLDDNNICLKFKINNILTIYVESLFITRTKDHYIMDLIYIDEVLAIMDLHQFTNEYKFNMAEINEKKLGSYFGVSCF